MRTACDSAFVRRTARLDTRYWLHVFVAQRQRHQSEGLASVRSNRTEDTPAAAHGCGPAPVKREVRLGTERRLTVRGRSTAGRTALDGKDAGSSPAPGTHAFVAPAVRAPPW
jgi:hypothetical protein